MTMGKKAKAVHVRALTRRAHAAKRRRIKKTSKILRPVKVRAIIKGEQYHRYIRITVEYHTGQIWPYLLPRFYGNVAEARDAATSHMDRVFKKRVKRSVHVFKPKHLTPYNPPRGTRPPG